MCYVKATSGAGPMRGLIKTAVGSTCHWTGFNRLLAQRAGSRQKPLIVGYHRVVPDFNVAAAYSIPPMLTGTHTFERQLDWIGKRFDFVTLDDVAAVEEGKKHFNRPVAAITFDDGYADTYHHAWPILRRKGIPAAVFVVTDLIGSAKMQIYDELYLLLLKAYAIWHKPSAALASLLLSFEVPASLAKRVELSASDPLRATWSLIENLPQIVKDRLIETLRTDIEINEDIKKKIYTMDWEMLREISQSGFTIGSHTCTHPSLTLESWQRMLSETQESRDELQRQIGMPVEYFAYPDGAFDSGVVAAVAAAGYRCGFTTCRHRDINYPALTIPRRLLWENACKSVSGRFSPALMSSQINGVFDFATQCRRAHTF